MLFIHTHEWMYKPSPHTGLLKSQSRRLIQPDQHLFLEPTPRVKYVRKGKEPHMCYCVGTTYCVQTAYRQPALMVARLRTVDGIDIRPVTEEDGDFLWSLASPVEFTLASIHKQDVREINYAEVKAEGFASHADFFECWCGMHDPAAHFYSWQAGRFQDTVRRPLDKILAQLSKRPDKYYQAWALGW